MNNKKYLIDDFEKIFNYIREGKNITLFRMADGERSLMLGKPVLAQEGWIAPSEITPLGKALFDTMDIVAENVWYGISCPCCDRPAYYWYMSNIKTKNITFSNIFVNKNYPHFISEFEKLTRDAVIIANKNGRNNKIGNLNILKYYSIGDQCVTFFENELDSLVDEIIKDFGKKNNILYAVSAGPLSEIIIKKLYKNNPNNTYIDFGSSLDKYIHKKDTRPYTNPKTVFGKRNCWMFNPTETNFNVSVVLTTYKKPDALNLQLEAIKKQTLQPKEILLFQDGINDPYSITFKKEFLTNFNTIRICNENMGVWERFKFAKEKASSEYVCMFDDDTIPGINWLENCHFNMQENEGIYGTVGIVLKKPDLYPFKGFFRVGWHNPYHKLAHVDFVGHSWFFKKQWLDYMFEGTEEFQKFKYAAEDMGLSFKCKEHGIPTFVPPHPYWDLEQWGSKPKLGMKFGTTSTAISQSQNNRLNMKNAINLYLNKGWSLVRDDKSYNIHKLYKGIRIDYYKRFIKKVLKRLGVKKYQNV